MLKKLNRSMGGKVAATHSTVGAKNAKPKFLDFNTRNEIDNSGSFYEAIGPVLVLAQIFGFMPVSGIYKKTVQHLSFKWSNFRTVYSIFVIFSEIFIGALTYYRTFSHKIQFSTSEPVLFYGFVIIVSIKLIFVAKQWPTLMEHWERVESKLPPYSARKQKQALAKRIRNLVVIAMGLSLVEHLLSSASLFYYVTNCPARDNAVDSYLYSASDTMFQYFPYSRWLALYGKYISILCTFLWNFMDVFVMIISIGLSERFRQVNESLKESKGLPMPESFWMEHRVHYRALCVLCDEVDDAISLITLVSFSNNLYFVCGKLLRSINKKPSFAHGLYFWFSLGFLLWRTLMISLYSSEINDEAKEPIKVFRAIPKESWCREVKRFSEEVSFDVIALTGMKFFHITRSVVITVAGTIVTYELVLIQFVKDEGLGSC